MDGGSAESSEAAGSTETFAFCPAAAEDLSISG